jgi:hypothetical protein
MSNTTRRPDPLLAGSVVPSASGVGAAPGVNPPSASETAPLPGDALRAAAAGAAAAEAGERRGVPAIAGETGTSPDQPAKATSETSAAVAAAAMRP